MIPLERTVKSLREADSLLSEEEMRKVSIIDSIIEVKEETVDKVFDKIEKSNFGALFAYEIIDYAMKIRPKQMKALVSLIVLVANAHKGEKIYNCSRDFRGILIDKGIEENDENLTKLKSVDDLIQMFPTNTIEYAIKEDNVDLFVRLTADFDFSEEKEVNFGRFSPLYYVNKTETCTYLQLMAYFGSSKCLKTALSSEKFDEKDVEKYAISGGSTEVIRIFEHRNHRYDNCFETAVKFHRNDICDWLLNNYQCESISQIECDSFYNERAKLFLKKNEINVAPRNLNRNIFKAAEAGDINSIRYLVEECKIDPNQENGFEMTALHYASIFGRLSVIKYLLEECGSDVNKEDNQMKNALHYATYYGRYQTVLYLVEKCGVKYNLPDQRGMTALHHAAGIGSTQLLKYFIEKCGDDPHKQDYLNRTPLIYAAKNGHLNAVKYLVEKCGEDVQQANKCGMTPLYLASQNGCLSVVEYLVNDCNAKVGIIDIKDACCIQRKENKKEIIRILQSKLK